MNRKLKSMFGATIHFFMQYVYVPSGTVLFQEWLMRIVYSSFREDAREDQGAVQERNQNESGGGGGGGGGDVKSLIDKALSWAVAKVRNHPVSQCSYVEGDPNITSYEVIYRIVIERHSMTPYPLKFHDPSHIITGIACLPIDAKTSSPEVKVVSGGVRCKEVEIILTPVQKGGWACCVQINGIAENHLEMNPVPNQLTM
jgi:hypothetical protein